MLTLVNNLAIPVAIFSATSYTNWSCVQDSVNQWWYAYNAVEFFLTSDFLGML